MNEIAIKVFDLGKEYRIGAQTEPYKTFRTALLGAAMAPVRGLQSLAQGGGEGARGESFWALKDVNFEIKRGDVVGVIGRNGAGKSTLLKILSRITEPTVGGADVYGRVGSLLEVGTGFHPELTGRENVYLNGAIIGMRRSEIEKKFDEIVAFAEIEKFIETPVKHYSSGMYLRLAFAVAAHLEPEILLVDEVLAVGDAAFQKKCLGKMGEVAQTGRTVLFVSHNLGAVGQLCNKGILLEHGSVNTIGSASEVIGAYLDSLSGLKENSVVFEQDPNKPFQILRMEVMDDKGRALSNYPVGAAITVVLEYVVRRPMQGTNLALILSRNGMEILSSFDTDCDPALLTLREAGSFECRIVLPTSLFKAGLYSIDAGTGEINRGVIERHPDALAFRLDEVDEDTTFKAYAEHRSGIMRLPIAWESQTAKNRHPAEPWISGIN